MADFFAPIGQLCERNGLAHVAHIRDLTINGTAFRFAAPSDVAISPPPDRLMAIVASGWTFLVTVEETGMSMQDGVLTSWARGTVHTRK